MSFTRAVLPLAVAVVAGACGTRSPLLCEHDVRTTTVPPTLYFVLDHSGSMSQGGKWDSVRTALGSVADALEDRAPIGVAMFPALTGDGCDPGVEKLSPIVRENGDALRAATSDDPAGGTPLAATLATLTPHLVTLAADAGLVVVVVTDGGPNCNAAVACTVDRCTDNIDGADQECTPGGENCCTPGGISGPQGCLDDDGAVSAVAALAASGVRTFVLGVPGSEPYAQILDRLAIAGGTARAGAPRYYRADGTETGALSSALSAVVQASETSCDLRVAEPVLKGEAAVFVGGAAVPPDAKNGWIAQDSRLSLRGAACDARRAGAPVRVVVDDQCVH